MAAGVKPPTWFWIIALILVAWNVMGVWTCVDQIRHGASAAMWPQDDYHRAFYAKLPSWYNWVYAVATFGGLLGAIALLLRERRAIILFWISLIAVVVQFGWTFAATDMIAHEGMGAAAFPVVIALVGAFSIWFAGMAARRGWIGAR